MVLSSLPEASVLPSGEKATLLTEPSCPISTTGSAVGCASDHKRMVPSLLPEASVLPSDAKATLKIQSSCPLKPMPPVRPSNACKVVRPEETGGLTTLTASMANKRARCGYCDKEVSILANDAFWAIWSARICSFKRSVSCWAALATAAEVAAASAFCAALSRAISAFACSVTAISAYCTAFACSVTAIWLCVLASLLCLSATTVAIAAMIASAANP